MEHELIKRSSFSFYAFGDSAPERDFTARNFTFFTKGDTAYFSFELMKNLDYFFFISDKQDYDTYVFEESFVIKKIISILEKGIEYHHYKLQIKSDTVFELNLSNIKVQTNAIVFQSFQ